MARHVAFLRAVNVGGRVVRMDALVRLFERRGFTGVGTFLASGNVIFEARGAGGRALEARLEGALRELLGYEVPVFLRTPDELAAVAAHRPFEDEGAALNVAFLRAPPGAAAKRRVMALRSDQDDFRLRGRELWWRSAVRQSASKVSNAAIEKALQAPSTLRGVSTVRRLVERLAAPPE